MDAIITFLAVLFLVPVALTFLALVGKILLVTVMALLSGHSSRTGREE